MFFWHADRTTDPPTIARSAAAVVRPFLVILGPDPTVLIDPPFAPAEPGEALH
jgi:hypothetical protein